MESLEQWIDVWLLTTSLFYSTGIFITEDKKENTPISLPESAEGGVRTWRTTISTGENSIPPLELSGKLTSSHLLAKQRKW
jgi:hypothetical protein